MIGRLPWLANCTLKSIKIYMWFVPYVTRVYMQCIMLFNENQQNNQVFSYFVAHYGTSLYINTKAVKLIYQLENVLKCDMLLELYPKVYKCTCE